MLTIENIVIADLSVDQRAGNRCAVCNATWYIPSISGPGYNVPHIKKEVEGVELTFCVAHLLGH
jgi:hypothetical protein